jgi:hypothetical protein
MKVLANLIRRGRRPSSSVYLLAGLLTLGTASGFSFGQSPEKIQAGYVQDGNAVSVTLIIYDYTTPLEKHILSVAFDERQDQGLAAALSKTKAAGLCSLTGNINVDVAFIESVVTPTGREITFIANRPLQSNEVNPSPESKSFDLLVGQFDINDNDNTKSTGFLYPASKLAIDEQGKLRYDLAGSPWPLINIFDSNWAPVLAARLAPRSSELKRPTSQSAY